MFPQISTLSDLVPHIEHNKQIRVKADELTGHTVVCYMVQDEDTFAGTDLKYAVECRGITFHPDGKIAARTLSKFFNIGEHESVQPHNLPWGKVTRIMDKRDGSMITPVLMPNGSVRMKTKKTFTSTEAITATEMLHRVDNGQDELEWTRRLLQGGLTPTFEFTSPRFPIVLKYEKDELTLLHIRENVSGRYLNEEEIAFLASPFPVVKNLKDRFIGKGVPANLVSWDLLKQAAETETGIEGWVIQFEDGNMVKLKTKWYCDLHKTIVFLRERDVARIALDDKIDDLVGHFALVGKDPAPVRRINRIVLSDVAEIEAEVMAEHAKLVGKTKKEAALAFKGHRLFGLIMKAMDGKEVDAREWYGKNVLEQKFSLAVIDTHEEILEGDV